MVNPKNHSALVLGEINGENNGTIKGLENVVDPLIGESPEEEAADEVSGSLLGHAQRCPTKLQKVIMGHHDYLSTSPIENKKEGCWAASPAMDIQALE